jgi:cytochrome P450
MATVSRDLTMRSDAHKEAARARKRAISKPTLKDIEHIPGDDGSWIVGHTLQELRDPVAFTQKMVAKYGDVYRLRSFGGRHVTLHGPEGNELVLFDKDKNFSSELGWGPILDKLFPRGLMLLDFEEHRDHRKIMSVAFKTEPMKNYIGGLNDGITEQLPLWANGKTFKFYPAVKDLTLRLAAPCFLGVPFGPETNKINQAFADMVLASVAPIRQVIPGTKMYRGVKGREYMCGFFAREIGKRRANPGTDMFSQFCTTKDENGYGFSDQDIIDHMNFLMMAAHDTLTSSVTSLVWLLGRNPEWQDRIAQEVSALGISENGITYDMLAQLPLIEMAFKESLRINPPVPGAPRLALRDFTFKGHHIPAGLGVGINPMHTHRDPNIWPEPLKFDPLRFTEENSKGRHKYAWVPFGGGAHMCLGLHFAYMQAKVFFASLLRDYRIILPDGAGDNWQAWPIPRPKDGLPMKLVRV